MIKKKNRGGENWNPFCRHFDRGPHKRKSEYGWSLRAVMGLRYGGPTVRKQKEGTEYLPGLLLPTGSGAQQ